MFTRGQWKCLFILHFSRVSLSLWQSLSTFIQGETIFLYVETMLFAGNFFVKTGPVKESVWKNEVLERTWFEKMVPVKDSVWRNCSCKGHGLQRRFLWRMWSVKTFPVKDRMFELVISNACKGPGLGRYFLQRRSGFFTPICKQCVFVLAALPPKVNAPARPFD